MYGLGAAIAAWQGHSLDLRRYGLGQLVVSALQLMTHYANDYFDYDTDRINATPTRWSGGSRVLSNGQLPRIVALVAAIVLALIGLGAGLVLAADTGELTMPIVFGIFVLAWAYSAPPLRLCGSGAGEATTALVVTVLVPVLGFYIQTFSVEGLSALAIAVVPLALLQVAMLIAIEFPDAASDAATGKRTLVVRLGAARAAWLYAVTTTAAYGWLPIAVVLGLPLAVALAAALPLPIAAWRIARISEHRDREAFERLTLFAVVLVAATAAGELTGFLLIAT